MQLSQSFVTIFSTFKWHMCFSHNGWMDLSVTFNINSIYMLIPLNIIVALNYCLYDNTDTIN